MSRRKPRNGKNRWRAYIFDANAAPGQWHATPEQADKDLLELRKAYPDAVSRVQRQYFSDKKLDRLINSGVPHHA